MSAPFQLTPEQQQLIDLVRSPARPRIALLTGGPGSGKSRTVAELVHALRRDGRSVALTAPSGKAARRLAELIPGQHTSTIHRALNMRPESTEWTPLTASVVVADEASMIDTFLFAQLLQGCFEGGGQVETLLLVGDPHQLPPVGPGQPFHDVLRATTVELPTVRLTKPHRAAEGSLVVANAYRIRDGQPPEWGPDFQLVEEDDAAQIPARVAAEIERLGLQPDESQVMAAQKGHACGVDELNKHLEAAHAKATGDPPAVRGFRVGSKVINTKNDYDLQVFNGEVGQVCYVEPGPPKPDGKPNPQADMVVVEFPDAIEVRTVTYRGKRIEILQHAWALTVHKSQGSEWDTILFVAHRTHHYMLTRSLLYVATTRAKKRVVVIGQKSAVEKAVGRDQDTQRKTALQRWLGCPGA